MAFLALTRLNRIFLRVLYCLLQPVRDFLSFDEYGMIQMSSDNLMLFGAAFFVLCVFFFNDNIMLSYLDNVL